LCSIAPLFSDREKLIRGIRHRRFQDRADVLAPIPEIRQFSEDQIPPRIRNRTMDPDPHFPIRAPRVDGDPFDRILRQPDRIFREGDRDRRRRRAVVS
jgi:hypothetical protein